MRRLVSRSLCKLKVLRLLIAWSLPPELERLCSHFDEPVAEQLPKTIICLPVNRVNRHSAHTSCEQHFVDIADQSIGLGIVDPVAVSEVRVLVRRADHDPSAVTPHQIGPNDDAGVVVLETLGRVDTSDLVEPGWVRGP